MRSPRYFSYNRAKEFSFSKYGKCERESECLQDTERTSVARCGHEAWWMRSRKKNSLTLVSYLSVASDFCPLNLVAPGLLNPLYFPQPAILWFHSFCDRCSFVRCEIQRYCSALPCADRRIQWVSRIIKRKVEMALTRAISRAGWLFFFCSREKY